jgi:pre-mRNA-splicing factor 38B
MLTIRMTSHQMDLTLKHVDSPYIRGIGFLYLRFVGPPDQLWTWIEPYLHDEEEIQVEQKASSVTTIGNFVRSLFSEREYYGTPLPRLPLTVERDLKVKLLQAEKVVERAQLHFKNGGTMAHFQKLGSEVKALYGDEDNPIKWYTAVVDRVITRDEASGTQLKYPRFIVTFSEYGNTETVTLGEMDMVNGKWMHDRLGSDTGGRRNDRSGYDERHLYEEVRQRERDTVTANKGWTRRPPTTKNSLSQHGKARNNPQDDGVPLRRSEHAPPVRASESKAPPPPPERKRTHEELATIAEKKRKLMAKYG